MKKKLVQAIILVVLALGLVACGNPTNTPVPPTDTIAPTTRPAQPTPTSQSSTGQRTTAAVQTTQSSNGQRTTLAATVAQADSDLTAVKPERTVIKTFSDAEGRSIKLTYGRGSGHGGDYGWAHILGKHINGIWYDGGTITTFPKAVGTKSPAEVVELIGKSLQDKNPDSQGGGRRSYVYAVPGTNRDVFTVVGNDGTIITSYPVPHGSKDEDS